MVVVTFYFSTATKGFEVKRSDRVLLFKLKFNPICITEFDWKRIQSGFPVHPATILAPRNKVRKKGYSEKQCCKAKVVYSVVLVWFFAVHPASVLAPRKVFITKAYFKKIVL